MTLSPTLRKAGLTLHVVLSVGWLGAVMVCEALAAVGLMANDAKVGCAAYTALALATQIVVVPLGITALLTGVAQSVGTPWGVVQHYWVIAKLLLTTGAVALLLLHTRAIDYMAKVAATSPLAPSDFHMLRVQLLVDASAALVVLLVVTGLSIYKPRGLTRFARRSARTDQ